MLQRFEQQFGGLLERYRAILRAAVVPTGGVEVNALGGRHSFVFSTSSAAIAAAATAQRAFGAEPWPAEIAVRVRMGIASGAAVPSGADYQGDAFERAAHVCDAAHGGQVLVSEESVLLAGSALPPRCHVVERGRYVVQSFPQPALLFQLHGDGLESSFPALRVLPAVRHNLPAALSAFIGREVTVKTVTEALAESRLVTLIGPGGAGKTRIALEVAAARVDGNEDGVWFVDLAPISDGQLVAGRIAEAIGVRGADDESAPEALARALRDRRTLVVLDNCEQVLEETADIADHLLSTAPHVHVLATSRQRLAVSGERVVPVPPLDVPEAGETAAVQVLASESVRLFLQRATERRPDFRVVDDELPVIVDIVTRLDGMPLAIELAAARVSVLTIAELDDRLNDRFRLLTTGPTTAPHRQQTLAATLEWSHEALSPAERATFRRVSVFAAGFSLADAEAVVGDADLGGAWVLDLIDGLVRKSLLSADVVSDGTRYRYLETIRVFARLQLAAANEDFGARQRHASWMLGFVERARPGLRGPESGRWSTALEAYHDDIRSALQFALDSCDHDTALRLAVAAAPFWLGYGYANEGRSWLEQALAGSGDDSSAPRIHGLIWLADLAFYGRRDSTRGLQADGEAIALAAASGNHTAEAMALASMGNILIHLGRGEEARAPLARAIDLSRQVGDVDALADALTYLGALEGWSGSYAAANRLLQEARRLQRDVGDPLRAIWTIQMLGELATEQANYDEARQWLEEALAIANEIGDRHSIARLFGCVGHCHLGLGDLDAARHFAEQYLVGSRQLGDRAGICYSLADLGEIARLGGDLGTARTLLEESIAAIPEGTDIYSLLIALNRLGGVARLEGDFEAATDLELRSLRLAVQANDVANVSQILEGLGELATAQEDHGRAVFLFSVSAANRTKFGVPIPPYLREDRDDTLERSRLALDGQTYEETWVRGQKASLSAVTESLLA